MISHHRPCGRWCFARLIRQAETLELQLHSQPPSKRTALSELKRSCFRFAPLTLRCRTEPALRAAPVFRSAYFPIPHRPTFGAPVFRRAYWLRQTLRLQPLRGLHQSTLCFFFQNAHASGSLRSPSELRAETFFQKVPVFRMAYSAPTAHCAVSSETLMLQPLRGLRTPHRPPVSSPLAAAAALWLPCVRGAVRRQAGLRGCLRIRGKGKGRRPSPVSAPNRLFELLRCFARLIRQAETLELQPHSRPPNPAPSSRLFSISRRSRLRECRHRAESTHHLTPSGCVPSGGAGAPPAPPLPPPSRCRPDRFKGSP